MNPTRVSLSLFLALLGSCSAPQPQHAVSGTRVRGAAGAALMPYAQAAAHALAALEPALALELTEARSNAALQKLSKTEVDLAFTARPVRAAEYEEAQRAGRQLHMAVIAAEAVAVVVHPDNPLRNITQTQLHAIFFSGAIADWAQLSEGRKQGTIHVIAVNPKTSGTGELFVSTVAGDAKPSYVAGARILDFSDDTVAQVAGDPDAISFSGMGNVDASVANLTLDGVAPTEKAILDTSYLLSRKLFVVSAGLPRGASREVVKYLLSDPGQRLARASGVTPIALD
jgi:phosphate transport system substrate-binding protein